MRGRHVIIFLLTVSLVVSVTAQTLSAEGNVLNVAVTMPYLAHIVKAVGGDKVVVTYLIPPGVDPHDYEPPYTELVKELRSANLVVMTGPSHLALETRIKELREDGVFSGMVIDYRSFLRYGLTLLKNPRTGLINPHGYFFSYSGIEAIAKAVAAALSELDPSDRLYFTYRASSYVSLLESFRSTYASRIAHERVVLVSPVLQYVAEDLGLNVTYVLLPDPSVQPTQADLKELKSLVKTGEASAVLITDLEVGKNPKIIAELRNAGIAPVVIPVTSYVGAPDLIPSALALSLLSMPTETEGTPSVLQGGTSLMLGGIIAEAVIIIGLIILLFKWRKAVIETICKEFSVG